MPIVEISLVAGRDPHDLQELMRRVTQAVADSLAAPPERIRIPVHEVPAHLWSVGGPTKAQGARAW